MKVPYNYLPQQFSDNTILFEKWSELIASSEYTLGPYVENFEQKFAEYVGARFAIATNNGTDSLILALRSLRLDPGFEAIVPANTFYASAGAIVAAGGIPVFCDVDNRYQLDIESLHNLIGPKTKVILPVHWAGASPNMDQVIELANEKGLFVVEDACMGIGGSVLGKHPGTHGIIGAFSMHPLKSLNVIGDGGICVTDDPEVYSWMARYRNHGMRNRDEIEIFGVNMRIQPLQAVVAMLEMDKLDSILEQRRQNAALYDQCLQPIEAIKVPKREPWNLETFSLYMVLAEKRDLLVEHLNKRDIEVKIHYPIPLHKQVASKVHGLRNEKLQVVEDQAGKLVTIPVHQFLTREQLDYVIYEINEFYKAH